MLSSNMASMLSLLLVSTLLFGFSHSFPEQGKWIKTIEKEHDTVSFMKSMYKGSQISVSILCDGPQLETLQKANFTMQWIVRRSPCAQEYNDVPTGMAKGYLNSPDQAPMKPMPYASTEYIKSYFMHEWGSSSHFYIPIFNYSKPTTVVYKTEPTKSPTKATEKPAPKVSGTEAPAKTTPAPVAKAADRQKRDAPETAKTSAAATPKPSGSHSDVLDSQPMMKVWEDGYYLLVLSVGYLDMPKDLKFEVTVRMMRDESYIGAVDKPLLIFFGIMGLVYIGLGIAWLFMLACNWRDLLRIQFWIGGVILLGMLEKAVFFAEYESVNNTGQSVRGAIILAEVVSCMKRALARMLVIIVSLGFGIVKPRLGQTLHKVLLVGLIYMVLASIEGCTRALASKSDQSRNNMLAAVPLAVTDAVICWWIFSSLLQTTRTLRLRRNVVKLSLFRHFTNTLIFAVLASVAYMIWFLSQHRFKQCLTDWRELWVDDAFWHILFSVILFIIMILWRPNANNQRYAFSPLLDAAEDDEDDDQVLSEAYEGMKMRSTSTQQRNGPSKSMDSDKRVEDDLKWVEENIPSSLADKVLPALDSDEEIMNTRFEVSKME